jgi:hypothetical protein
MNQQPQTTDRDAIRRGKRHKEVEFAPEGIHALNVHQCVKLGASVTGTYQPSSTKPPESHE